METQDNNTPKRRKITPCKECTNRYSACWGTCEAYKEWKEARIEEKRVIAKAKAEEKAIAQTLYGYRDTARFRHIQEHRRFK